MEKTINVPVAPGSTTEVTDTRPSLLKSLPRLHQRILLSVCLSALLLLLPLVSRIDFHFRKDEQLRGEAIQIADDGSSFQNLDTKSSFVTEDSGDELEGDDGAESLVLVPEKITFQGLRVEPVVKGRLRVICVIVKNEAQYLKEWIDFHLLAGWTRISIWDHNSTDNPQQMVQLYPAGVVEYTRIDWPVNLTRQHRSMDAQYGAYNRCARKYWNESEALATIDVDEFVFPARHHWNDPDPFLSAARALNASHPGSGLLKSPRMMCPRFGYRHLKRTPTKDYLFKYDRRAPFSSRETASVAKFMERAKGFCNSFKWGCGVTGPPKRLYILNNQTTIVEVRVHRFVGPGDVIPSSTDDERTGGFICNHLWVRSLTHLATKGAKNANNQYLVLSRLAPDHVHHQFYSLIEDRSTIDFARQAIAKYKSRTTTASSP